MRRLHLPSFAVLLFALSALPGRAWALACSSVAGTVNWSAPGSWTTCGSTIPQAGDTVTIIANSNVTLDLNATITSLTFAAAATANSLTQNGTSLTVSGAVTMNQPTAVVNSSWNINNGTATVGGLVSLAGTNTTAGRVSRIQITTGELNANAGMTFAAAAVGLKQIIMSGGDGSINLKGALTVPALSATLTAGTAGSTFNYADTVAQTINYFPSGAYHNLHINNTAATGATLSAAVTAANVTGNIRVQSGLFRNGGFAIAGNASRTFEVANGAAFEMSGTSTYPTAFGTFAYGPTSTVRFLQTTTPFALPSATWGHLELKPAANTRTMRFPAGAVTINGNLVMGNGTNTAMVADANTNGAALNVGGNVTISANSTFQADNTSTMTVSGSWTNSGTFTNNSGFVVFDGTSGGLTLSGTLTGATGRFFNLTFDGVGGGWTNSAALETNNNLTITNGTLTAGNAITVTGNWTNNGTFTAGAQTVTFNATTTGKSINGTLTGASAFNNLTFNGAAGGWSNTAAMEIDGALTVTAGTLSGTNDITVVGAVTGNGTSGTITLTGGTFENRVAAAQAFGSNVAGANNWTFNNLTFSNSTGVSRTVTTSATGTGQIVVNGTLTVGGVSDTAATVLNNATNNRVLNVNDVLINPLGTLQASSSASFLVGGNWTNDGTFTPGTGTVTFDATATGKTIAGNVTGTSSFYNVTFNGTGGGWSCAEPLLEIDNDLVVTAGTLSGTSDFLVVGSVTGNGTSGTINLTGGTFEQRVAAAETFGSNVAGANNWTFSNLTFSNSSGASRTITFNGTGTGQIVVTATMTVAGAADTFPTIVSNTTNNRILNVGHVLINAQGTVQASSSAAFNVEGSFTNLGTLTPGTGTVTFDGTGTGYSIAGNFSGTNRFNNVTFNGAGGQWNTTATLLTIGGNLTVTAGTLAGTGDVQVNGAVAGNGTTGAINMTGGTFEHRVAAAQTFGTNAAGANDWTFFNLTFSNSSAASRTITFNATGTGDIVVTSTFTVGGISDTFATVVNNNTNDRVLTIGSMNILALGTYQAASANELTVTGDWTRAGTYTHNNSTVTFAGGAVVHAINGSNTFYAMRSTVSGGTLRFAAGGTTTVVFSLDFSNVSLLSSSTGSAWNLTLSGSTQTLTGVTVRDSNAAGGTLLLATGGINLGNNTNWDFDIPEAIADMVLTSTYGATMRVAWSAAGDDDATGTIAIGTVTIQYTTDNTFSAWSPTAAQPGNVFRATVSVNGIAPGAATFVNIPGLTGGSVYYARLWTKDDANRFSAISNSGSVTVAVINLDLSLSQNTISFGSLGAGSTTVITTPITVTNTGNVNQRYQVSVANPATWTLTSGAPGTDQLRVMGLFRTSQPASADFAAASDVLTTSAVTSSSTVLARDADADTEKGINVAPGASRNLWFRVELPSLSTTNSAQTLNLSATAIQ